MKRVFKTAECEEVGNFIHIIGAEKHENQNERLCRGTESK